MTDNDMTFEEWGEAFEIELEALEILTKKIKKNFEEERMGTLKYKKNPVPPRRFSHKPTKLSIKSQAWMRGFKYERKNW